MSQAYAGAGLGRGSSIRRKILVNRHLGIATSASCNVMQRPWRTTLAPILIGFSRKVSNVRFGSTSDVRRATLLPTLLRKSGHRARVAQFSFSDVLSRLVAKAVSRRAPARLHGRHTLSSASIWVYRMPRGRVPGRGGFGHAFRSPGWPRRCNEIGSNVGN